MKKIAMHNLGCKVNSYEMDVMAQKLEQNGYKIVPFDEIADVYIVNTCTVTNIADRKSRQMLHRAKERNPDAVVVAVGCYVQTGMDVLTADASVDLCIGNNRKSQIVPILERFLEEREKSGKNGSQEANDGESRKGREENAAGAGKGVRTDKTLGMTTLTDLSVSCGYEDMTLEATAEHTRAYIKIQDGCNQFCSYCLIPMARGRVRSRGEEAVLSEVRGMVQRGYKEVVLTGIHISSYGIDFLSDRPVYDGQSCLIDLVEKINGIDGLERIRLGSLEPRIITEDTAARLAELDKLCPHFHLSLQSGCDATLKRMNRKYTSGEYLRSVELLRQAFPHPAITTDIIVGFPGETEEEFAESRKFIDEVDFYETHVFKYSRRDKTRAAAMKDQIPETVKNQRSDALLVMTRHKSRKFREFYIGKAVEVLFEEEKELEEGRFLIGHTRDYVKVAVEAEGQTVQTNEIRRVDISGMLTDDILLGKTPNHVVAVQPCHS